MTSDGAVRRWDQSGTVYFYGGPFSCFAPTPGLRLPYGYFGHTEPAGELVAVRSVEHWFHACKAQSRDLFEKVLEAPTPRRAKYLGGPDGIVALRPDWEQGADRAVMRYANRHKFDLEPFRTLLLLTGDRPLVENSREDFKWGGRDEGGGYTGQNLLGCTLMAIRGELAHAAQRAFAGLR